MENSGDDLSFNPAVVKSYEESDDRFRRILLVLLSLTCGLSGRGPEMTVLKYLTETIFRLIITTPSSTHKKEVHSISNYLSHLSKN